MKVRDYFLESLCAAKKALIGDFAINVPLAKVFSPNIPPNLIQFLMQTGNKYNKEIYECYMPSWYISPAFCRCEVVREITFTEKYIARRFCHRDNETSLLRKKLPALGMDETKMEDIIERMTDCYDKFWYYLDEKTMPPIKKGPFSKEDMLTMKRYKQIEDLTFVGYPCYSPLFCAGFLDRKKKITLFRGNKGMASQHCQLDNSVACSPLA